jgi:hypothetical protein
MMAKQTFTTGQVLTAAQLTSLQQTAMLGGDANAKVASYVLVAADAGTAISMSNGSATTITVNTGLFAAGDTVTILNLGAGVCTITAGTATVTTSGSLALAQNQGGVLRFTSASAAIFFQFATPASGDIEGVTAGTGISGGGTSGTVTITNSMATEITAKGDLIVGTGNATFDNLPVGTNGHTLVADSSVSPTGLKWAVDPVADVITTAGDLIYGTAADTVARLGIGTAGQVLKVNSGATAPEWGSASAAAFVGCTAYKATTSQSISNATDTAITYNTEEFDTDGFHSTSSNTSRFTIPSGKAGKYLIVATATTAVGSGPRQIQVKKNGGTDQLSTLLNAASTYSTQIGISGILDLADADYLELFIYQESGGSLNALAGQHIQRFSLYYLGA